MANRYTKMCSTSLVIKTTVRYYVTPTRMARIKKSDHKMCWQECGEVRALVYCWWDCKMVQPLWKTVWHFLKKLNIELPYDSALSLLDINP